MMKLVLAAVVTIAVTFTVDRLFLRPDRDAAEVRRKVSAPGQLANEIAHFRAEEAREQAALAAATRPE